MNVLTRSSYQGLSATLHRVFESLTCELGACALVLPDGASLFVSPATRASGVVTIGQAAGLCHRYLKLHDGDIAIANDPYSGGTALSEFTLTLGIKIEGPGDDADLLLVQRLSFAPWLEPKTEVAKLDDEGVRVPPTPLASRGELNRELLQAIASHPKAPGNLADSVAHAAQMLFAAATKIKRIARDPGTILKKANFKTYLEDSSRAFDQLMTRLPLGTTNLLHQLSSGETLKLQLNITEDLLHFDFAGSENSPRLALTELATFGACFAATVSTFDLQLPFNAGTFQHFQVSAPARTILSAAPPTGTFRGMNEGIAAVFSLSRAAIAKLAPPFKTAESGIDMHAKLVFAGGRFVDLAATSGGGASAQGRGPDAYSSWNGPRSCFPSMEIESRLPLQIMSQGLRADSGGNGKNRGGHGATFGVMVLEPCELRWIAPSLGARVEGADGGRAGQPARIEVLRSASSEREEVSGKEGALRLSANDQVFLLAAGGGGFGAIPESESTE